MFNCWIKSGVWLTIKSRTSHSSVDHHHHASLSIHPPPTTKAQLGPTDSCTSLPLWLTQLGFSSFIFRPDFLNFLLSYFEQIIHPAISSVGELTLTPSLCLKLRPTLCCFCDSTPSLQQHPQSQRQTGGPRTTGEVTPGSSGSVSVSFDRGPEKRGVQLSQ